MDEDQYAAPTVLWACMDGEREFAYVHGRSRAQAARAAKRLYKHEGPLRKCEAVGGGPVVVGDDR
ncbi:hypothetical protein LCGC14_3164470 [marine sediment metagenome]|uniref:Uncharacterized protein n=1 Tax=marine sediment metagenome TaxID=412755 RepID=A0A0F8VNY9_9ZZZZ